MQFLNAFSDLPPGSNSVFAVWSLTSQYFSFLVILSPLVLKDIVGSEDSAAIQGYLTSLTAASGFLFCILLGYYSDKLRDRVPFIRVWTLCFCIASFLVLHAEVSKTVAGLVFARLVPFSVMSTLTYSICTDIASSAGSGAVLKLHTALGAVFSVSLLLGNICCGALTLLFPERRVPALISGCVLTASAVVASRFLPSAVAQQRLAAVSDDDDANADAADNGDAASKPQTPVFSPINGPADKVPETTATLSFWGDGVALLRKRPLLTLMILSYSMIRVGNVNSFAVFVLYTAHRWQWGIGEVSAYLCLTGIVGAVAQAVFVKWCDRVTASVRASEMTRKEAGTMLNNRVAILLAIAVATCVLFGFVNPFFLSFPMGICAVLPGVYTSKISAIASNNHHETVASSSSSSSSNLVGFSLGLVGTLQNLLGSMTGSMMGQLLRIAIANFAIESVGIGLPFFVNAGFYVLVLLVWLLCGRMYAADPHWAEFDVRD